MILTNYIVTSDFINVYLLFNFFLIYYAIYRIETEFPPFDNERSLMNSMITLSGKETGFFPPNYAPSEDLIIHGDMNNENNSTTVNASSITSASKPII